jgi:peroxiredoxin
MLAAGSKAPDFILEDASGNKLALSDAIGRGPVLLAFYKISCPVCQLAFPFLERIANGTLQVIAISQNDARGTLRFQQTYGLTMPTLLDREEDGYQVSNAFGITQVPSLFLVETDGSISLASNGFVKRDLEAIGRRAGIATFGAEDHVPEWKAG